MYVLASEVVERKANMKFYLLRLGSVALLMMVLEASCLAAPGPPSLEELPPIKLEPRRHSSPGTKLSFPRTICDLAFSQDNKTLYATILHRGVRFFDVASRKSIGTFEPKVNDSSLRPGTAFSPDGKTAAYFAGRSIVLWNLERRRQLGIMDEDRLIHFVVFSPDSQRLSVYSQNNQALRISDSLSIWNVEKKQRVATCNIPLLELYGQVSADSGIKIPLLKTSNRDPEKPQEKFGFRLIDAFTGQLVLKCEWDKKEAAQSMAIAVNRTETTVAAAGYHSSIQLWDRSSGRFITRFKHCPGAGIGLQFSPDGNILACLYRDQDKRPNNNGLVLYAVPSGKVLADIKQPEGILAIAFSPNGRLLAVEHGDEIRLWRIPDQWRRGK